MPSVPIKQEVLWPTDSVWTLRRRQNFLPIRGECEISLRKTFGSLQPDQFTWLLFVQLYEKNEMGWACGAYG